MTRPEVQRGAGIGTRHGASSTAQFVLLGLLSLPTAFAASPGVAAHQVALARLPIAKHIRVPPGPGWLEIGFGSVWVSKSESKLLLRIDPASNRVIARIKIGSDAELGLGMGLDSVWVPDPKDGTVTQIDPDTNRVVRVLPVALAEDPEGSIGVGADSLWVMTNAGGTDSATLTRLDARSGRVSANIPVPPQSHAVIFALDAAWVTSSKNDTVSRIDPKTNRITDEIKVPSRPRFLAASNDSIWILSQGEGNLVRLDANTRRVVARIALEVPGEGGDLAIGEGYVWVSAEGTPISQIDPSRNELIRQYVGGKKDDTLRVGFGSVWVLSELDGDIWRIDIDALNRVPTPAGP